MSILAKIKQNIAEAVNTSLKNKLVKAADLVYPPKPEFGDLSLPCFELARKLNKTAVAMAEFMVGKVKVDNLIIASKAIGPFLNFTLNQAELAPAVIGEILKQKEKYGL